MRTTVKPPAWLALAITAALLHVAVLAADPVTAALPALALEGNTDFALALYRDLASTGGNVLISPHAIAGVLTMTAEAARGATADEMGRVLRLPAKARRTGSSATLQPWDLTESHRSLSTLNQSLTRQNEARQARVRQQVERLRKAHSAVLSIADQLGRQGNQQAAQKAWAQAFRLGAELNQALADLDPCTLRLANALWGERTVPFRDECVRTICGYYGSGSVTAVNFRGDFTAARQQINRWTAEQTQGSIPDILPEVTPAVAEAARLILTSAVHFRGDWCQPFDAAATSARDFTLTDGTAKPTVMMHRQLAAVSYAAFNADGSAFDTKARVERGQTQGLYPDREGFALLELPYGGNELAMLVILPNANDRLSAVESLLTSARLSGWTTRLQRRAVDVSLPKCELMGDYNLVEALQHLGLVRAFCPPPGPDTADLSGLCASADPALQASIMFILHKAVVVIEEKGSEAAAVTAPPLAPPTPTGTEPGGGVDVIPFVPTFNADRPFLFIIRHRPSGTILFIGRMVQPEMAGYPTP